MTEPAVLRGLEAQLAVRRERLAAGERGIGWKIGLNVPFVQETLGISSPVIGFMTDAGLLASGASYSTGGTTMVAIEPEVALHIAADVGAGADDEQARAAIGAIGAAIEVVDIDLPFDDVEPILAGNIFHRAVVLGDPVSERAGGDLDGVSVRVERGGEVEHEAPDAAAAGDLPGTVRLVADLLAEAGNRLRAGETIIAGSLTPPVPVSAGDSVRVELGALGALTLDLVA